jgi:hypothetical protein
VDQKGAVVGKIRKQLHREMMRIGNGIRVHFLLKLL